MTQNKQIAEWQAEWQAIQETIYGPSDKTRTEFVEKLLAALEEAAPAPPPRDTRASLIRVMRAAIAKMEHWKRDNPARDGAQWMDLRAALEHGRFVLTGEDKRNLSDAEWAMESRTNTGFAAGPSAPTPELKEVMCNFHRYAIETVCLDCKALRAKRLDKDIREGKAGDGGE